MSAQLDLFGGVSRARARGAVGHESLTACSTALANALAPAIRLGLVIGGAALERDPGAGPAIPEDILERADGVLLRAAGLDHPFYRPLHESEYRRLAARAPASLCFVVKAPQSLTTDRRPETRERIAHFLDARAANDLFVAPCVAGLGEKAGPLVFQFPSMGRLTTRDIGPFLDRMSRFLDALPRGPQYMVELRDRELLRPETMRALSPSGARLCLSVHARLPSLAVQAAAATALGAGPLLIRWHLPASPAGEAARTSGERADRLVEEDAVTRHTIARLVREQAARGGQAWVIANPGSDSAGLQAIERLALAIGGASAD